MAYRYSTQTYTNQSRLVITKNPYRHIRWENVWYSDVCIQKYSFIQCVKYRRGTGRYRDCLLAFLRMGWKYVCVWCDAHMVWLHNFHIYTYDDLIIYFKLPFGQEINSPFVSEWFTYEYTVIQGLIFTSAAGVRFSYLIWCNCSSNWVLHPLLNSYAKLGLVKYYRNEINENIDNFIIVMSKQASAPIFILVHNFLHSEQFRTSITFS